MSLFVSPRQTEPNLNGIIAAGWTYYFYAAGTSTAKTVYQDASFSTAHGVSVVSDANGRFPIIYLDGSYKVVLKNAAGVEQWTEDNYTGISGATEIPGSGLLADLQAVNVTGLAAGSTRYMIGRATAGDGAEGTFIWRTGDKSTEVAADEVTASEGNGGIWIAPASDKTGASGAWERINVNLPKPGWYGPVGSSDDIGVAITRAINGLPSTGGIIDCRDLQGAHVIESRVAITKSDVMVLFGSAEFTCSGAGISHDEVTFGAQFYATAENVWLVGNKSTKLKLAAGAQSTLVVFGTSTASGAAHRGGVIGIELDGNKANNTSQSDDTFQSGIQIIVFGPTATKDAAVTIEYCDIHDFNHYGIVTYGDQCHANIIKNNRIYSNGKNDANGTGDGIYINLGSSRNEVEGNHVYSNQRSGIRLSCVGVDQTDNRIVGNWCYSNTINGIYANEETSVGSVTGKGQSGLEIVGNHCYSNTEAGIRVGTFDSVGFIKNFIVESNVCYSNGVSGILVDSNSHASNNTRRGTFSNNQSFSNTGYGLRIGTGNLDHLADGNQLWDNTTDQLSDLGTRTRVFGNSPNDGRQGTFTPNPLLGGAQVGMTFADRDGTYRVDGDRVHFTARVVLTAKGSSTGALTIDGLPFTAVNAPPYATPTITVANVTYAGEIRGLILQNTTAITMYSQASGSGLTALTDTAIANNSELYISGSYEIV